MVIDDNEITRDAFAERLRRHRDIQVLAAIGHEVAMAWPAERWGEVDVVVVDAADPHLAHDQFPGVAVVRRIRSVRSSSETQVLVVTAQFFHDGLRRRMREASADFFFFREDLNNSELVIDAVLHPDRFHSDKSSMEPLDGTLATGLGIDTRASVNDYVKYVSDNEFYDVVDPRLSPRSRPTQRNRWWVRFRQSATNEGHIQPTNRGGGPPSRDQNAASLGQLRALWVWATQIWPGRPPHDDPDPGADPRV